MPYKTIKYRKRQKIATITLNRPDVLNALNREMLDEITHAVHKLAGDKDVVAATVCVAVDE